METRTIKIKGRGVTSILKATESKGPASGRNYNIDIECTITGETKYINTYDKYYTHTYLAYTANINKAVFEISGDGQTIDYGKSIKFAGVLSPTTTNPDELFYSQDDHEYFSLSEELKYFGIRVEDLTITNTISGNNAVQQLETAQMMFTNLLNKVSEAATDAEAKGAARTAEIFNHKYLQDALANII